MSATQMRGGERERIEDGWVEGRVVFCGTWSKNINCNYSDAAILLQIECVHDDGVLDPAARGIV